MKQILDYLKIEKLGATVLPPFEKFEGLMAAKVSRRNSENFVVAKWNEDFLTPDVAFDPNTNLGMVDEFLELYENEDEENSEVNLSQNSIDTAFDEFASLEDENTELIEDEPDGNFELTDNEEIDEELGGEELEVDLVLAPEEQMEPKEVFPIFETLKGDELSEWLLSHSILHKSTLSKLEKVKLCEKYVSDLDKSE